MAELNRGQVAAVLAADTKLDLRAGLTAVLDCHLNQLADALLIQASERVGLQDLLLKVTIEDRAHVVTGEAVGHLGQVVGTEGEELCFLCDLTSGDRCARGLDHGTNHVLPRSADLPLP